MELVKPRTKPERIGRPARFNALYNALLDFCRVRLALINLLDIKGFEASQNAAQAAGIARRAALSQIVKTALNYGVEYSVIADVTTRLGAANLTTGNAEKVAQALATNIEIHLLQKERANGEEKIARLQTSRQRAAYAPTV